MLKRFLIAGVLLSCFSFYVKRQKNPPGTVKIFEHFFADETEISNFSWLEFEYDIKRRYGVFSKEHLAVIPDTTVWLTYEAGDVFVKNYYRSVAYRDYPVVGISHEQARLFCEWRNFKVKQYYSVVYKKELKINYRLPKEVEWEFLNVPPFSLEYKEPSKLVKDSAKFPTLTLPVYSRYPNLLKIYNLIGNVAEMVEEKGISKGGSFAHSADESLPGKQQLYQGAQAWLGFRCVCEYTVNM